MFQNIRVQYICAGIFKQSMGARNGVGIGLSYRPARLQSGGAGALESTLGLFKSLKIRSHNQGLLNILQFIEMRYIQDRH